MNTKHAPPQRAWQSFSPSGGWSLAQLAEWCVFGYILATGFSSWLRWGLLLFLSCLLIRVARHKTDQALQLTPRSFVPLAVYLGPIVVSWAYANTSPSLSLFDQLPSSLVLFLAVVTLAHRPGFTHRLAGVLTAWITLLAFDALTQFYIGHGLLSGQLFTLDRVTGPFTVATDLVLLPIAFPFVFWHLNRSNRISYAAWLTVPLIMVAILLSGSRNAWSGLLLAFLLVGYLSNQRVQRVLVTKMFCLLLVLLTIGYIVGASLFLAWIGPCGRVGGIVVSAFPPA